MLHATHTCLWCKPVQLLHVIFDFVHSYSASKLSPVVWRSCVHTICLFTLTFTHILLKAGDNYDRDEDHLALFLELLGKIPRRVRLFALLFLDMRCSPYWQHPISRPPLHLPHTSSSLTHTKHCFLLLSYLVLFWLQSLYSSLPAHASLTHLHCVSMRHAPQAYEKGKYSDYYFRSSGSLRHITKLRYWPLERVLSEKYQLPLHEVCACVKPLSYILSAATHLSHHSMRYTSPSHQPHTSTHTGARSCVLPGANA